MTSHASTFALPRAAKATLAALLAAGLVVASPRPTLPGLPPPEAATAPDPARGHDSLRALIAGLALHADTRADIQADQVPRPDAHALRQPVTAFAVRLAVDRQARHRLDGRLEVRPDHLGSPGKSLRLVSLEPPAPAGQAVASPQAPVRQTEAGPTPRPAPAPAPQAQQAARAPVATPAVAVRNPSPAPGPQPVRPAVQAAPAAGPGRSVLVTGDSLSLFLAEALRPLLANRPGTAFAAKGKVSSGLARPDFFDWEREMARQSAAARPDTVVIMIATNDNQTLTRPDGGKVAFGRPGWEAEYARRVRRLVEVARAGNPAARVYWIGAPVMADARLNADVAAINAVIARQVARLSGCRFVDVSRTLADASGRYVPALPGPSGPRPIRTRDGVHLLPHGARLLADACLAAMSPSLAALSRP